MRIYVIISKHSHSTQTLGSFPSLFFHLVQHIERHLEPSERKKVYLGKTGKVNYDVEAFLIDQKVRMHGVFESTRTSIVIETLNLG